jgi:general L-amino acid transport system permease protein
MMLINNIIKPKTINQNTLVIFGSILVALSFLDVVLLSVFNINLTGSSSGISFFVPLFIGFIGLYYIRFEHTNYKFINTINKNLNSDWFNSILTLFSVFILLKFIPIILNWFIFDANFVGTTKEECTGDGACWIFINVWLKRFTYGLYPDSETWRINLAFILLIFTIGVAYFSKPKIRTYIILFLLFVFPFIALNLISGDVAGLTYVETDVWGGLALTLIVSIFAIIFCFPLGVFLAMGRRSELPVIRYFSVGFIELWRGVPLITVLFMAANMFPLFLPEDIFLDKLIRCIIGIILFEAAYMAEVVRGGLQSLPKGQYEAAKSIGMGYWRMHLLVILPQALKIVIPGIANTFIALFKDTPLIFIVGLLELIGMIDLAKTNPKWLGFATEGYVFAALVYFIFCYSMSRYSQRLEKRLSTER